MCWCDWLMNGARPFAGAQFPIERSTSELLKVRIKHTFHTGPRFNPKKRAEERAREVFGGAFRERGAVKGERGPRCFKGDSQRVLSVSAAHVESQGCLDATLRWIRWIRLQVSNDWVVDCLLVLLIATAKSSDVSTLHQLSNPTLSQL